MTQYPARDTSLSELLTRNSFLLLLVLVFVATKAQKPNDAQLNKDYVQAVTKADNHLLAGEYLQALNEYDKAGILSVKQRYPGKKIDQINKTLANTALMAIFSRWPKEFTGWWKNGMRLKRSIRILSCNSW